MSKRFWGEGDRGGGGGKKNGGGGGFCDSPCADTYIKSAGDTRTHTHTRTHTRIHTRIHSRTHIWAGYD